LKQTIDSVEDLLNRRCFAFKCLLYQGVNHRSRLSPLSILISLGQSRSQEHGEADLGFGTPARIAARPGLEWSASFRHDADLSLLNSGLSSDLPLMRLSHHRDKPAASVRRS
jgi:hypothetical protein